MKKASINHQANYLSIKPANKLYNQTLTFQVISDIRQFKKTTLCIIIPSLNPDFSLLLGFIKVIITQTGSSLSHLSILAREHQIPILKISNIIARLPKHSKSLKVTQSKIFIFLIIFLSCSLILPNPTFAFLPASTINLITQSNLPLLLGLLTSFLANIAIVFKSFKKRLYLLLLIPAIFSLILLFTLTIKQFKTLKQYNQYNIPVIPTYNVVSGNPIKPSIQYIQSSLPKLDPYEALTNSKYILIEPYSFPSTRLVNAKKINNLSTQILNNSKNPKKIDEIMASHKLSKKDNLVFVCDAGWTGSVLAFILNSYGYNVNYLAKSKIPENLLNQYLDFSFKSKSQTIIIDKFNYQSQSKYIYFLFNIEDQYVFTCKPNQHKNSLFPATIDQFTIISATHNYSYSNLCYHNSNFPSQINLKDQALSFDSITSKDFDNKKVICQNQWHCFLTRHAINYLASKTVNKIYCLNC